MRKHFYWSIRKRDKFLPSYKILAGIWSKLSKFLKNVYINIYYKCILIILRVQISSIRFFVFKNAFISKQNESTDQLKYCRCLLLFPISQAIFKFHLEKMTRLWRRSNFRANFRFLRKKWIGDLLHPSEQSVRSEGAMWGEYGCDKTSHLSVSKYFFTTLATWGRALSWRRITLSCLCSYFGRFSRNAWLKRINCSRYRSPVMKSPGFSNS